MKRKKKNYAAAFLIPIAIAAASLFGLGIVGKLTTTDLTNTILDAIKDIPVIGWIVIGFLFLVYAKQQGKPKTAVTIVNQIPGMQNKK